MAQSSPNGRSTSVSLADFNERVRALMKDRPDPKQLQERRRSWASKPVRPRGGAS